MLDFMSRIFFFFKSIVSLLFLCASKCCCGSSVACSGSGIACLCLDDQVWYHGCVCTYSLVMLKLFTGEELLWSGTTVGGWACPADVLESIFIDGYRN